MRGFESSLNPVFIRVDGPDLPVTEVQVDGSRAEASAYGILAEIGDTRYFVPWERVVYVRQLQPVQGPSESPVPTPPTPLPSPLPAPPSPPLPPRPVTA